MVSRRMQSLWVGSLLVPVCLSLVGCGSGTEDDTGAAPATSSTPVDRLPGSGVVNVGQLIGKWDGAPHYRTEYLSPVYTIDRIIKSMEGPVKQEAVVLMGLGESELIWITGYRALLVDSDGETAKSPEFMCHVNMDVTAAYHATFPTKLHTIGNRLFSLDQGTLEVELPEGFGIPALSDQPVLLVTQVLNHNVIGEAFDVRMRLQIEFVRNRDLTRAIVPLAHVGVFGMVLLEGADGHFYVDPKGANDKAVGPGCSLATDMGHPFGPLTDGMGRLFSSFWRVEPGRHEFHTRVTPLMRLPFVTTVHFMSAHLHPYAESIELVDLTTGKSVHKLMATQSPGQIGLERVETYSSAEGLPLHPDHEYDLVSIYNNDSGKPQDAMSVLLMYVHVRDLKVKAAGR